MIFTLTNQRNWPHQVSFCSEIVFLDFRHLAAERRQQLPHTRQPPDQDDDADDISIEHELLVSHASVVNMLTWKYG